MRKRTHQIHVHMAEMPPHGYLNVERADVDVLADFAIRQEKQTCAQCSSCDI